MKTMFVTVALLGLATQTMAQEQDTLEGKKVVLDEVLVKAVRVTRESPITFSNLTKEEIAPRNLGQDIPILMNYLPSVVTTSDAGAGVGYTGIRVRGTGSQGINVTINGIPYNDPESHGTFWVNMPDFASSTESLQLQRGVGTSTNGAGAFGASLNILTDGISEDAYGELASSYGSFNTLKNTLKFSTGLLNDRVEIAGRLSRIVSDGYIDRASSDLDSYFLQGAFKSDKSLIKALVFGGHEVTYQAWYGTPLARLENDAQGIEQFITQNGLTEAEAANLRNSDRRYNYYTYENEVDNYKQNHAQLLWNQEVSTHWSTNLALHYTRGRGYFEQFREDDDFDTYGFAPITVNGEEVSTTDLIRRRWLDNDFYGTVFSAHYQNEKMNLMLGGGWNKYEGDHFGEVIWAQYVPSGAYKQRYYDNASEKTDFNLYSKLNYNLDAHWSLFADMQYRTIGYTAHPEEVDPVDDTFNFFNPKVGASYRLGTTDNLYVSYAVANREPNRNDYENGNPKPERLQDVELGWRHYSQGVTFNANGYYMRYKDQLVLTGELNDVGAPLRANVGDSYRLGIEVDAQVAIGKKWQWRPNMALSQNRNIDFVFQRDGELRDLGNTRIAYSPSVIAGNSIAFRPNENFAASLLTKYVGKQYMGNIDSEGSVLDAFSQTDVNVVYRIPFDGFFKELVVSGLVNNLFDADIVSNGYFFTYDDTWSVPGETTTIEGAGYYPQAGINFLVGATVRF